MQHFYYWCLTTNWPSGYNSQECVQFFSRSKGGLLKPHGTNSLLKRFSGFYRVILYTSIFTGLHNPKFAKVHWFFCFNQKSMKVVVKQAEPKFFGKFSWKISLQYVYLFFNKTSFTWFLAKSGLGAPSDTACFKLGLQIDHMAAKKNQKNIATWPFMQPSQN